MQNTPSEIGFHTMLTNKSIARNLTVSLVGLLILILISLLVMDYFLRYTEMQRSAEKQSDEFSTRLAETLSTPMWIFDERNINQIGLIYSQNELIEKISIFNSDGRILFELSKTHDTEPDLVRTKDIIKNDKVIGKVSITFTLAPLRTALNRTMLNMSLIFSGMIMALCILTGILLRGFLKRPLAQLKKGMDRVALGEFDHDFNETKHIELSGIVSKLMAMSSMIQARERSLQQEVADRRKAEGRLALAAKGTHDGIWDWDLTTGEANFSDRLKEITGYRDQEISGSMEEWKNRVHPDDKLQAINTFQYFVAGIVDKLDMEFRFRHMDGRYRHFHIRGVCQRDKDDRPIRVAGAVTDITMRKTALDQLKQSEQRYRTLIETTSEAYISINKEKRILDVNEATCNLLGYTKEEMIGKTPMEFMNPKSVQIVNDQIAEWDKNPNRTYEFSFLGKDGKEIHVLTHATTVYDETGQISGSFSLSVDISARKEMENQLRHQATHDPLTELTNRTVCMDRIRQALERARRRKNYFYAVVFVDLDRFKIINDSLGHRQGDELLVEVSNRLLESVRDLDTVSRFGGDEFIILLEELSSPRQAIQVVKRMRHALRQPITLSSLETRITASIGIVLGQAGFDNAEDLLQYSNIAMHRAKAAGRDRFKVFSTKLLDRAVQILTMEKDMTQGIHDEQFILHYQPIVSLNGDNKLNGFEALVRWNHPLRGMISPGEFIPVAEDSGLINELGLWVLRDACLTMARWREKLPEARDLYLSVNLSGRQFSRYDLARQIGNVLEETGLPPDRLKMEITETAIMENAIQAADTLKKIKQMGVSLSVDDFGTGYSSMSYLQKLPLDNLKIDLSFVRTLDKAKENVEIIKAIISLAHTLGLDVVAEGVEIKKHQEILLDLGCEYSQGYLYSPPVDRLKAEQMIVSPYFKR